LLMRSNTNVALRCATSNKRKNYTYAKIRTILRKYQNYLIFIHYDSSSNGAVFALFDEQRFLCAKKILSTLLGFGSINRKRIRKKGSLITRSSYINVAGDR
jgi:hypothetical protein